MSYSNNSPPFVPYPNNNNNNNNIETMGFWPQSQTNSLYEHGPPIKRPRKFDDRSFPINQPIGKIFFKTRICLKFKLGQCPNGDSCSYAHGEEELRKPPPNWQELVSCRTDDRGNGNWEDDDRIIHRMKLCKKFYNGEECPYGDRCNFLHKEPSKFRDINSNVNNNNNNNNNININNNNSRFREISRESSAISIGTTPRPAVQVSVPQEYDVSDMANGGMDRGNVRSSYWKTRICTKFEMSGHCPFGDSCHFAHGQAELFPGGGRSSEVEPATVSSAPLQPAPPLLANEPVPVKIDTANPSSNQFQVKKCFNLKGTKKLNRIYGDWLGDMPLYLPNDQGN